MCVHSSCCENSVLPNRGVLFHFHWCVKSSVYIPEKKNSHTLPSDRHFVAKLLLHSTHAYALTVIFPVILEYFRPPGRAALNWGLKRGCKKWCLAPDCCCSHCLPSPRLHSASSSQFKEEGSSREAFYDFIEREEAFVRQGVGAPSICVCWCVCVVSHIVTSDCVGAALVL